MPSPRDQLPPVQHGVDYQEGCEAVIHDTRSVIDHPSLCEEMMLLMNLDNRNALNT